MPSRSAAMKWANQGRNPAMKKGLGEALYTLSETVAWPDDVSSVSEEQAILCWKLVERLRREAFPDHLRM